MKTSSNKLTPNDAVQVWLRHWRGEYQHSIAASYGVNQGRICEILKSKRHAGTEAVAAEARKDH